MSVLIDATAWSLALRRRFAQLSEPERRLVAEVERLVAVGQALLLGPIRQEVLSGVRGTEAFAVLRDRLRSFPDVPTEREDYERAAEMHSQCASRGVRGSHYDFLLCSVAERIGASILTTDRDFDRYVQVIRVSVH